MFILMKRSGRESKNFLTGQLSLNCLSRANSLAAVILPESWLRMESLKIWFVHKYCKFVHKYFKLVHKYCKLVHKYCKFVHKYCKLVHKYCKFVHKYCKFVHKYYKSSTII